MKDNIENVDPKPDNSRNKAYGAATTRLRDAHREEFNTLLAEEYKALGLAPRIRRTPEQIEAERAAKEQVKAEREQTKRLQKIAKLQAEIAALAEDEPLSIFLDPSEPVAI